MKEPINKTAIRPQYNTLKINDITTLIEETIARCYQEQEEIAEIEKITWKNTIDKIEMNHSVLNELNCIICNLNNVLSSEEIRECQKKIQPQISEYYTNFLQNKKIYKLFQFFGKKENKKSLNKAQETSVKNYIQSFKLSGISLKKEEKEALKELDKELNLLSMQFSYNVLDSTQAWSKHIKNEEEMKGLTKSFMEIAKEKAKKNNLDGWLIDISMPSYMDIMKYAENEDLRKEVYTAYNSRGYCKEKGKFDNSEIMIDILKKKYQSAKILGFNNYAEKSLSTKIAKSEDEVIKFLNDLFKKSKKKAEQEIKDLKSFAKSKYNHTTMKAWDTAFYSEKMKQDLFDYDSEYTKNFFELNHVVSEMLKIVEKLFGMKIVEEKIQDAWHQDVKYFNIKGDQEEIKGAFYMDLITRDNKKSGAWVSVCKNRVVEDGKLVQYPIANLICNFSKGSKETPSLLNHSEIVTLFHEFGHILHHVCSKVDVISVSGINSIALDAVEVPSQFLENWCYEPSVIKQLSKHYQTKEILPDEDIEKIIKIKNYQSATQMIRQLDFSLFDIQLHKKFKKQNNEYIQKLIDKIKDQTKGIKHPKCNKFQNSFSHIFAGGYSAGYYSYKWSEVMSADAFAKFKEEGGVMCAKNGKKFMEEILEKAGSENFMQLFKAFRGRNPDIKYILEQKNIS